MKTLTFKASLCVPFLVFVFAYSFAHVDLDNPTGGEFFTPGTNITIKWTETQEHGESNWDLFYSLDGGDVWQAIAIDLEKTVVEYAWEIPEMETIMAKIKIVQDNNEGTDYDGISENFTISVNPPDVEDPGVITALEDIGINSDTDLHLSNYPNPFNGETTIKFSLSKKSHIQLNVYNMLGKIVFSDVDKILDEGTHRILWKSHGLSNGIYLCRLVADDQKITRKMILSP